MQAASVTEQMFKCCKNALTLRRVVVGGLEINEATFYADTCFRASKYGKRWVKTLSLEEWPVLQKNCKVAPK